MAVGTALSVLRTMLNAECGEEMDETISPARVIINNQLLNNQQAFLANLHTYLRGKAVVSLAAVVGTQYYNLPTGIDFDRLEEPVYTNITSWRYRMEYGIGQEEYNVFRSELGVKASPVMRWQLVNVSGTLQIELWPIPSVAQSIVFTGILPITAMTTDASLCVIDDMALVLFTAAEILARKQSADAQAKGAKAKAYLDSLKASFPSKYDRFNISGAPTDYAGFRPPNSRRPVVAVNAA